MQLTPDKLITTYNTPERTEDGKNAAIAATCWTKHRSAKHCISKSIDSHALFLQPFKEPTPKGKSGTNT